MTEQWKAPVIEWPRWSQFLWHPKRYKVPYGGRGSSKSWTVARALIELALRPHLLFGPEKKSIRILCARELQNSIEESVHQLLKDQIAAMGYERLFLVEKRSITCLVTGSEFIFSGIQKNVNKIKSMERIDICWIEEAEKVSDNSWKVIIPTIRQEGSEIWVTFNPDQEEDPTYQRFIVTPPDNAEVVLVNWRQNPWFPQTLRMEKDYLFRVDPEAAMHVWEGHTNTRSEAVIFRNKYRVEAFTPHTTSDFDDENWRGPYFGSDWGFSVDPTVLTKLWVHQRKLYIEKESWHLHLELDDIGPTWRKEIPECADGRPIRGDCSRPETISHVRKSGLNVVAAEKWKGSVEDGIAFLRSFEEIIIHPRCTHQIEEARLYKYKVDPLTGDVTTDIVDKHNHCWDADRYALEPAIKGKKSIYDYL